MVTLDGLAEGKAGQMVSPGTAQLLVEQLHPERGTRVGLYVWAFGRRLRLPISNSARNTGFLLASKKQEGKAGRKPIVKDMSSTKEVFNYAREQEPFFL